MEIKLYNEKTFEEIKHIDENGNEYWLARELQEILAYKEWRNFVKVIEKAKQSIETSEIRVWDHFVDVNKMVEIGSDTVRTINDIVRKLTKRYKLI